MIFVRFFLYFSGRINRAKFWLGVLAAKVVLIGGIVVAAALHAFSFSPLSELIYLWIIAAVSVKRLHDMDQRGWLFIPMFLLPLGLGLAGAIGGVKALIGFAGIFGLAVTLYLGAPAGTEGANRFGPDPLGAKRMAKVAA